MNYNNLCYNCFCEKQNPQQTCPRCGYRPTSPSSTNILPPGTLLNHRYIVGLALGAGGFGITYKCYDSDKGGICAIKEYFPLKFASRATYAVTVSEENIHRYKKIMQRFIEEATLVQTLHHKNIITIYDSFFANNTAYYVMEYCDGIDLRRYTRKFTRRLGYDEGMNILGQVMDGLEYIHKKGVLHRDIAPDNIYVTGKRMVKILDFGSARREMDQLNRELSVIVKVGYAPVEQYGGGKQSPATDIYALGATFYHLFTGQAPVESTQRVFEDRLVPFSRLRPDLPDNLKYCIEKCMVVDVSQRVSSIEQMRYILRLSGNSNTIVNPVPPHRQQSKAPAKTAEVGARVCAYAIDTIVWGTVYAAALSIGLNDILNFSVVLEFCLLFPIVFTIINTFSELVLSTTLGKAILKLYVCGREGGRAAPGQILVRNLVKLLNVFVLMFSKNGKLLEDRLSNSMVCMRK